MKSVKITSKFIAVFITTLLFVLSVMLVAFVVGFRVAMESFVKSNIYSMHAALDENVLNVVHESVYLYSCMVKTENVDELTVISSADIPHDEREKAYHALMDKVGVNDKYFNDVTLLTDYRFSMNDSLLPAESSFSVLYSNPNSFSLIENTGGDIILGVYSYGLVSDFSGIILFYMDESCISDICNPENGEGNGYSFLLRTDGYIVSHKDKSFVGKSIVYSDLFNPVPKSQYKTTKIDGVKRIVVTNDMTAVNDCYGFGCRIVSVLDYGYYFDSADLTVLILSCIAFIMFAVAAVVAVLQARKITRPVLVLNDSINAMVKTPTTPSAVVEGDEIEQLENNYNAMLDRIFALMAKNEQDLQMQRKLELDALQMQINPHFLYNTLDALSWMAKRQKQPEIERLVITLAKFFRLSLHNGEQFITVADELEIIERYLEINEIRFPRRVSATIDVEDGVRDCKTLKLILQPIVENCLKYAFPDKRKRGEISIRAYTVNDDLYFEIKDNGVGFDYKGDLAAIQTRKDGGFGLMNVDERIKLQYGDHYGLTILSKLGEGTCVTVRLKKMI